MKNQLSAKLPIKIIKETLSAVNAAKKQVREITEKINALGTEAEARTKHGEAGVAERLEKINAHNAEIAEIVNNAVERVNAGEASAVAFLNSAFIPDGADITGEHAADVALLKNNLITKPEQLEIIIARNDNPAFRSLASEYASGRSWSGFQYVSKEDTCKEYVTQIFDGLSRSASEPLGYISTQYTGTIGEYRRIADEYGITNEFLNSDGASIDTCISE